MSGARKSTEAETIHPGRWGRNMTIKHILVKPVKHCRGKPQVREEESEGVREWEWVSVWEKRGWTEV